MIVVEHYRDPWMAEKFNDFIGFAPRQFACLDNSGAYKVEYEGKTYPTVTHAFEAIKFLHRSPEIADAIRLANSAEEAKKLGQIFAYRQDQNFESLKVDIMETLLRSKLEYNKVVAEELLNTGDNMLCNDDPYDNFWGIGLNRDGQNQLGKLWMKLRNELFRNSKTEMQM